MPIRPDPNDNPKVKPYYTARFEICRGFTHTRADGSQVQVPACPQYTPGTTICKACGCVTKAKVLIPGAKCPKGKW